MNKESILNQLKNTVGYHESDNKVEYLKGAGMAIDKCVDLHELVCQNKNNHIDNLEDELTRIKKTLWHFDELIRRVRNENDN